MLEVDSFLSAVDRSLVVDLARQFIECPSPTGYEADFAQLLVGVFRDMGLDAKLQTIYEDRHNAVGTLRGSRAGPTLLLSGHLDTSVSGDEDWLEGPGWKNVATVEGQIIYGNGIYNMKNAFVCYLAAVDALKRLNVHLPGDIIVAGTSGEIELAAVDEFQGRAFDSYGMGLRYLISHGYAADFHMLGEPTGLLPMIGNMGTVWAKVTCHGTFAHTAWADKQTSAIEQMWKLWRGLDDWIADFTANNVYMDVAPQVNRAAIRGGLPWRAARTPTLCSMYIDVRFPPPTHPIDVQRAFRAAVAETARRELSMPVDVEFYMSRPGTSIDPNSMLVQHTVEAYRQVTGEEVTPVFSPPVCSDAIDANRFGIPTIIFGAGGGSGLGKASPSYVKDDLRTQAGEFVFVEDLVAAAGVFGLTAWRLMNAPSSPETKGPMPGVWI